MSVNLTFILSALLMLVAFGFGALLGFNLMAGADSRRQPKLYEYRYKPVTLTLSETEVRARIRELVAEKEAVAVQAMMKGRAAKPVQRVTATMAPTPPQEVAAEPAAKAAEKALEKDKGSAVPEPSQPAQEARSADVINLGQRRPGLVFYRVDERAARNESAQPVADDRPPVSSLAALSPDAVVILVGQVGSGHEPFRLEAPDGTEDELSLISGVNEAMQRALNRLGIYHFWQIAAWGAEHVAWVAARLPGGERVARENWISQAARLVNMPRRVFNTDED